LPGSSARSPRFGARRDIRALDRIARGVAALILLNARPRWRQRLVANHRHGCLKRSTLRTLIGSALRRALRGRDFATRLAAILAVVRDAERHIANLLRRLHKGLTRLRTIAPLREDAAFAQAERACAIGADTS
jgi:hypothetical protein